MANKYKAIVCPNPKCHKKIEESILLNNLSTTPAEHYYACPYCFIRLDEEAKSKEDTARESIPSPPSHPSLEKVLDVISAQTEKEKEEDKKKEVPHVEPPEGEEKGPSECPHHFGYLASRAKDAPIPQECLVCPRIVECMLKLGA